MKPIRVMIVEDSRVVRSLLKHLIDADARLEVVESCATAEQALLALDDVAPDVISLDIQLPGMNGVAATRLIMERRPTPIVVVSRRAACSESGSSMEALRAGALCVIEKPVGFSHRDFDGIAERLRSRLAVMSEVKLVRQRFNRRRCTASAPTTELRQSATPTQPFQWGNAGDYRMLGVVASTGGPRALEVLFGNLGPGFPLPIVLVQHIMSSFQEDFISWLNRICPLTVQEARDGQVPLPSHVYVAPANSHLEVHGGRLHIRESDRATGHCPSGDVLLRSLAEAYGPRAIGVLLTGMGSDGAEGLLNMKQAGGFTVAEDGSTAVVNGMPEVARQLQAECVSLPLQDIGAVLWQLAMPSLERHT